MKILFVNSDQKLLRMYEPHLQKHFSVDSANNGLIALRKIKTNTPALVVSDYDLSWLSGIALLKFIRTNSKYAAMPFIFLTDHYNVSEGLSLGANDWLPKRESSPDLLLEKIYLHLKLNPYGV